jgi:ABC-type Fe3+/spermidine/putrescine transport system ATPase subunit
MTFLDLKGVSKAFGPRHAVETVSFVVQEGEFFSLLGPSGCGKTTLLRVIAGFERPDAGTVMLNGRDVTHALPKDRKIGMVFQNYALFPHMDVFENVAFGLRVLRLPGSEIQRRVQSVLTSVELDGRARDKVGMLSGGEQQRVAVARALVIEPSLLLFDEPLSNLDVSLRQRTREEIRAIQQKTRITSLYVTHDQGEAMSLSDRMAILRDGRIEQIGSPRDVFESPASPFVARFLGWPNVLTGVRTHESVSVGGMTIRPPLGNDLPTAGEITIAIPSDAIVLGADGPGEQNRGVVTGVEYLGVMTMVTVRIHDAMLKVHSPMAGMRVNVGDAVPVGIDWSRCMVYAGAGA